MEIIQVVGYKNSGKTTLAMQLIDFLAKKGLRVGSLKHHGHGGPPVGIEDTDSERHKKAGAVFSGVEGDGLFQLSSSNNWEMDKMIAVYGLLDLDVLVMEGFKNQPYKKIVMIRDREDLSLLDEISNIMAVISPFVLSDVCYPVFLSAEVERLSNYLTKKLSIGS